MSTGKTPAAKAAGAKAPKRGDIYNINSGLGAPTGTEIWPNRPGIIVSCDAINEKSGFVTIVYLTTSDKRDMPYHAKVTSGTKEATALCEQVFSVDKSRLGERMGQASAEEMESVDMALQLSLSTIGTSRSKSCNIIQKWIMALDAHGLSIMGNPMEPDGMESDMERVTKERDMYREMYMQQNTFVQRLMASQK